MVVSNKKIAFSRELRSMHLNAWMYTAMTVVRHATFAMDYKMALKSLSKNWSFLLLVREPVHLL
jgi:hypothetical protein